MASKWRFTGVENYVKIYEDDKGNIRCVYPKAPKWAQEIALKIYKDACEGMPTKKGVKNIVRGRWAKIISEGVK